MRKHKLSVLFLLFSLNAHAATPDSNNAGLHDDSSQTAVSGMGIPSPKDRSRLLAADGGNGTGAADGGNGGTVASPSPAPDPVLITERLDRAWRCMFYPSRCRYEDLR